MTAAKVEEQPEEVELTTTGTMANSADNDNSKFHVTAEELSKVAGERTEESLNELLSSKMVDAEADPASKVSALGKCLMTDLNLGLSDSNTTDLEDRRRIFGSNSIEEKKFDSFLKLCWDAVQDFVLIMLIALGIVSIVIETTIGNEADHCTTCWIEGAAILTSVLIVTLVTATIDYLKQGAFVRLTRILDEKNTKVVIRDGKPIEKVDADIVVGDVLSINSHALASIPADGILISGIDLKMNESSLTGESKLVSKKTGDVILSGTDAVEGSGKLLIIAVGVNSVAGKIKARVYADGAGDELDNDEDSPLTQKLELIAKQIGALGTVAALAAFIGAAVKGLAFDGQDLSNLVDWFIIGVTVLAVAVPEGLPLAVTLALAFSSNKMMSEQNLVKHLDACETMGCATTICTDKTGTLTANRMTARAMYTADGKDNTCNEASEHLAALLKSSCPSSFLDLLSKIISINTMDESALKFNNNKFAGTSGNPTECALLHLIYELGFDYEEIRQGTKGRATSGPLANTHAEGQPLNFTSARKMMSWAVPLNDTADCMRVYTKGASEVVLSRCTQKLSDDSSDVVEMTTESRNEISSHIDAYARKGMRTLLLAYRDISKSSDKIDALHPSVKNSDGSDAYVSETELIFVALVGIEDPLRREVPPAIEKCYHAGIDVRMVTGDSPNTAVSIAFQAGILRKNHFVENNDTNSSFSMVAENLKPNVLLLGDEFRAKVYRENSESGKPEFDQAAFDEVWPHLRVLARSSPDDKLTLAHGLNQSTLFLDKKKCKDLLLKDGIKIFPDRQVIAMTGDGTNDAPALKRADIGFAMGIAGTQIAKDAADIILLDDNFASIVTAAKWGRNVYASIQKFLQFQLTVNIAACVTALVGSFVYSQSPLAAIQLLWVNLIMDSLASLALASEPPTDELLERPPVNRSDSMVNSRMWANMIGQAIYQITAVMVLLFAGADIFDLEPGHKVEQDDSYFDGYIGVASEHYTMIFNTFVWMQLFNEINSRHLNGEFNVFKGMFRNLIFCGILLGTAIIQVLMVEQGQQAIRAHTGGLSGKLWGVCIAIGAGSLPMQQLINVLYMLGQKYKPWRSKHKKMNNSFRELTDGHY